ncbi:MAG: DNA cytosine methyltransferase [Burkholderiaceae bacterium]
MIPVLDLFAGPGGLGEGFSRSERLKFRIVGSIEKDASAHETLRLRAAHRALLDAEGAQSAIWHAWDAVIRTTAWAQTFTALATHAEPSIRMACELASGEAWCLEMSPSNRQVVVAGLRQRLKAHCGEKRRISNSVLIGGPPCQAYSVVGRSRNRGKAEYKPEADRRHFLYQEYLHVIREFHPAVFVMENVKGMLSSSVSGNGMFEQIRRDLTRPSEALGESGNLEYVLIPLGEGPFAANDPDPMDYLVKAEEHGIPQARHRVILCGIRKDVFDRLEQMPSIKFSSASVDVRDVIEQLPPMHAVLSYRGKGTVLSDAFSAPEFGEATKQLKSMGNALVAARMKSACQAIRSSTALGGGSERARYLKSFGKMRHGLGPWYGDRSVDVLANHEARAHMPSDLLRYLFVSSFGEVTGKSPKLKDFPAALLPHHANIDEDDPGGSIFKDRFRVQVSDEPSTTVTSHIAKDGHSFIHYDPEQCRSLTVREAARLQTFPDSYVFLGNRTSQYTQVGNAVPPLLAKQIADAVAEILIDAGLGH